MDEKIKKRHIAKDMIEKRIRSKWIGCNFEISIDTDYMTFTNIEWFKYRELILFNSIIAISLKNNFSTQKLCEKFNNSSSCIVVSNDSRKDYQSKVIEEITREQAVANALIQAFAVINHLLAKEKSILIAHGILGIEFEDLVDEGKTTRTLERIYNRALDDFAWGMEIT